jgi:hypothetical protein
MTDATTPLNIVYLTGEANPLAGCGTDRRFAVPANPIRAAWQAGLEHMSIVEIPAVIMAAATDAGVHTAALIEELVIMLAEQHLQLSQANAIIAEAAQFAPGYMLRCRDLALGIDHASAAQPEQIKATLKAMVSPQTSTEQEQAS